MIKKVFVGVILVFGGVLAFAAFQPAEYRVERSAEIAATPAVVYDQIDDFESWKAWSPWEKLDPDMKKTFSGPKTGVDASYAWQGNQEVGKGEMKVVQAEPPSSLMMELHFIEPFEATSEVGFVLKPVGADKTQVTWSMAGHNNFVARIFGLFMDMEGMIGADYEKGLAALSTVSVAAQAEAHKAEAEVKAVALALAKAPEGSVSLTGTMVCGHCALKKTGTCQNVLKVKEGDAPEQLYFLAANELAEQNHGPVCVSSKEATVVGLLSEDGDKKMLEASSITYAD